MYYGQDLKDKFKAKLKKAKDDNTDKYIDNYKYWNDQMKRGNHTNGIVTPADPKLTPIKDGKHVVNGTDYVSSLISKNKKDVVDNTDTFVDHYKYWNDQIKIGNHTKGIVTPADPELTPIKDGRTYVVNGTDYVSSLVSKGKKDIVLNHDTDQYVDNFKYWNDQMKAGNHTDGVVTPKNPELTPIKGFKHVVNGTDYVSSFVTNSKKDIKLDHDTDQFVDHYKYWND